MKAEAALQNLNRRRRAMKGIQGRMQYLGGRFGLSLDQVQSTPLTGARGDSPCQPCCLPVPGYVGADYRCRHELDSRACRGDGEFKG